MPDKSSNVSFSAVYSGIGGELLRITSASYNTESFSTAIKPLHLVTLIINIYIYIYIYTNIYTNIYIYIYIYIYSFWPTNNICCDRYADKTVMPVFCKYKLKKKY